jgi:hypothetical protein
MNQDQQNQFDALQASVALLQQELATANQGLQAAQNEITVLQAAQQGQPLPGQGQGQQNIPNVTFALSPALTNNNVVDLSSKIGYKLYETAIMPVHPTKFDGTKSEVQVFRDHVKVKALEQGWNSGAGNIFMIPDTSVTPNVSRDIVYRTQEVTTEQIRNFAATFINANDRATQNNAWACKSLFSSISDKLAKRVTADKKAYMAQNSDIPIAALLFKVIILKSETAGKASIQAMMEELKDLPHKIQGMTIDEFNEFVNDTITTIESYGETVPDTFLIDFIFQAYMNADDEVFCHHFKKEHRKYLKEESTYTSQTLLEEGEKEYNSRRYDRSRPWGALSKEQEEIVALTANLQTMQKKISQLSKSRVLKQNTSTPRASDEDTDTKRRTSVTNVPNWKLTPMYKGKKYNPGDSIMVKGKKYYFCPNHHRGEHHNNKYSGMWVTHKPDECNSKPDTSPVANESNVEATDEGGTQEEQIYEAALAQVELESDSE